MYFLIQIWYNNINEREVTTVYEKVLEIIKMCQFVENNTNDVEILRQIPVKVLEIKEELLTMFE